MRPERQAGRAGFTTGACAAAAARAATLALAGQPCGAFVTTLLPNGQWIPFGLAEDGTRATVIKDGGSGPDVTHGAAIRADVTRLPGRAGEVMLEGGSGVGRVTRPGLPAAVGEAAINPVPRRNILENVRDAGAALLQDHGLRVIISVPDGEILARRTLNPRLGVVGGISILGVSGLAYPYSSAAFKATVEQGVQVAASQQVPAVVFTTGGRTERYAMAMLPGLPEVAFVQMGDFVGVALKSLSVSGLGRVIVAGMPGKLLKMAEGRSNTHASKGPFDPGFLVRLAQRAGARNPAMLEQANTVAHALDLLAAEGVGEAFRRQLVDAVRASLQNQLSGSIQVGVLAFDLEGRVMATAGDEAWRPFAG